MNLLSTLHHRLGSIAYHRSALSYMNSTSYKSDENLILTNKIHLRQEQLFFITMLSRGSTHLVIPTNEIHII